MVMIMCRHNRQEVMISLILATIHIAGELIGNKYFELDGSDDLSLDYFRFSSLTVFTYLGTYTTLH